MRQFITRSGLFIFIMILAASVPKSFASDESSLIRMEGMLTARWTMPPAPYGLSNPLFECFNYLRIGVEGGGSNTRIRIESGDVHDPSLLYEGTVEQGSSIDHTPDLAAKIVLGLIDAGMQKLASKLPETSLHTCYDLALGMAGTENREGVITFLQALRKNPLIGRIILASDAEIAWLSVFKNEGIIFISGTGNIALGRNARGQTYRKGGFSAPVSDYPSAGTISFLYNKCLQDQISFENNFAIWPENIKLGLFEHQVNSHSGSDDTTYFANRLMMMRNQFSLFAAEAKAIYSHYLLTNRLLYDWLNSHRLREDACVNQAIDASVHDLVTMIDVKNKNFRDLPFALHGTVGEVLWSEMKLQGLMTSDISNRKVRKKIDPLAGALKMLED